MIKSGNNVQGAGLVAPSKAPVATSAPSKAPVATSAPSTHHDRTDEFRELQQKDPRYRQISRSLINLLTPFLGLGDALMPDELEGRLRHDERIGEAQLRYNEAMARQEGYLSYEHKVKDELERNQMQRALKQWVDSGLNPAAFGGAGGAGGAGGSISTANPEENRVGLDSDLLNIIIRAFRLWARL